MAPNLATHSESLSATFGRFAGEQRVKTLKGQQTWKKKVELILRPKRSFALQLPFLGLPILLLFAAVIYASAANPPAIKTIAIVSADPQLTIQSDLDVTNQIQSATNLNKGNWVVLRKLQIWS
jgi:hypothetical protein